MSDKSKRISRLEKEYTPKPNILKGIEVFWRNLFKVYGDGAEPGPAPDDLPAQIGAAIDRVYGKDGNHDDQKPA